MAFSMRITTGRENINLSLEHTKSFQLTIEKLPKAKEEHGGALKGEKTGEGFVFRGEEVIRRGAERRQISGSTTSADAVTMRNGKSAHSHTIISSQ